jgi:WD40 repeat protein
MTGSRSRIVVTSMMLVLGGTTLSRLESAHATGEVWAARYDQVGDVDQVNAMVVSPDGLRVFVTGTSIDHVSGFDVVTLAYEAATGVQLWVSRWDDRKHDFDASYAIAVSPDGSKVFVSGETGGIGGGTVEANYITLGIDAATGDVLWSRHQAGPGDSKDIAYAVAVSTDGSKVFVTGESRGSPYRPDWLTIAYDAATGSPLWKKRLGGQGHGGAGVALAVSSDGTKLFVAGPNAPNTSTDYVIAAYDPDTGSRRWIGTYDGTGNGDTPTAMVVSPDGSQVFVTGSTVVVPYSTDYLTVAWDAASGSQLWAQRYDGPTGLTGYDDATAIAVSSDGSKVFVTGQSYTTNGDWDYATLAYDAATGLPLWLRGFDGPVGGSDDTATSVAATPDGSIVFVTGQSYAQSDYDYVTAGYESTSGTPLGVRRYDAQMNRDELACCLAVTPDGSKVIVSGYGIGLGTNRDYLTVAYAVSGPERRKELVMRSEAIARSAQGE